MAGPGDAARKGLRRRRHSGERHDGGALDEVATRITPAHGWDDIFASGDVRAQLSELASRAEKRGSGAKRTRGRGITGLFSCPSGTGRIVATEILAAHLRLGLYRIDLARVVSKYIGETEKNLGRVFDVAEGSGAILLFDEADALFGRRTGVHDSHDHYANVEINYLLQRMEGYAGLSILAMNRRRDLGASLLRRFRFVVEFPSPPPRTGVASGGGYSRKKRTAKP